VWTKFADDPSPRDAFFGGRNHANPRRFGVRALCSPKVVIQDSAAACGKHPRIPLNYQNWTLYSSDHKTLTCINGGMAVKPEDAELDMFCMKKARWPEPAWVTQITSDRYRRLGDVLKRKCLIFTP